MDRPTLVEELEQIAANLEDAAEYAEAEYPCGPKELRTAASDIRVALDNAESSLLLDLTERQIDDLRDGETVEVVLEEDGDRTDKLQIQWKTVIESEGAATLHDELTDAFSGDG